MKIIEKIKPIYYQFLSKFVPRQVYYIVEGECLKCGKCCRYMYCDGLSSTFEFLFLKLIYPEYRRFEIVGKDENGQFVISCKLIEKDGLCPVYKSRAKVCKNYPAKKVQKKGSFHVGCGFSMHPEKSFKEFIKFNKS